MNPSLVDFSPALRLLSLAAVLALLPLAWWAWRQRGQGVRAKLAALALLTAMLTFDLVVFGAFTRLTDSGLGCPDWPGCYGHASPLGADAHIDAAEAALPSGPVTQRKAWIEMVHRYLAMTVGALILALAVGSSLWRRSLPHGPAWAWLTLAWVIVQGLFGKYTVTLKLYPLIVTLHLLGGLVLLAMLVAQAVSLSDRAPLPQASSPPSRPWPVARGFVAAVLAVLMLQVTLGGWVSTNYAVLACRGFPQCNGQWWPTMDAAQGFTLLRPLGQGAGSAGYLPFEALVAIHMAHRLFALVAVAALLTLAWRLVRAGPPYARHGRGLAALLAVQVVTGLSNVVLDWPLAAALLHTAGAAALVAWLTWLLSRASLAPASPTFQLSTRPLSA